MIYRVLLLVLLALSVGHLVRGYRYQGHNSRRVRGSALTATRDVSKGAGARRGSLPRKGTKNAPLLSSEKKKDVEYVSLDALKELWLSKGRPLDQFSESTALLEFIGSQDDDEDEEEFAQFAVGDEKLDMHSEHEVWMATAEVVAEDAPTRIRLKASKSKSKSKPKSKVEEIKPSKDEKLEGRAVGIDLGTTYSSVSVIEGGIPVIIPLDGARIVRSVVGYLPDGKTLVGEQAQRQRVVNPANTYASIKRVIGRTLGQVQSTNDDMAALKVAMDAGAGAGSGGRKRGGPGKDKDRGGSGSNNVALLASPIKGRDLLPEEVSAEVIRALIQAAEAHTREKITRAVITVPAYFMPPQCEATERAGRLAGLEKVKLLREPEAAALAYGLTQERRKIVLVFDLGGGTFDVSVLEVGGGFVEVIATSGDAHLGGDDWDRAIVDHVVQEMATAAGLSATDVKALQADPIAAARLLEAAEQAKIALSGAKETRVQIPLLFRGLSLDVPLSRGRFESLTKGLLARLLLPLREVAIMSGVNLPGESGQLGINEGAFADDEDEDEDDEGEEGAAAPALTPAQLRQTQLKGKAAAKERKKVRGSTARELRRLQKTLGDPSLTIFPGGQLLDDVVLVGGSTRIPAVQRLVRTITGVDPRRTVNPDEAVSLGAAVMAGILDGSVKNMEVVSSFAAAVYRAFYEQQVGGKPGLGGSPSKASRTRDEDEEDDEDEEKEEDEEEEPKPRAKLEAKGKAIDKAKAKVKGSSLLLRGAASRARKSERG